MNKVIRVLNNWSLVSLHSFNAVKAALNGQGQIVGEREGQNGRKIKFQPRKVWKRALEELFSQFVEFFFFYGFDFPLPSGPLYALGFPRMTVKPRCFLGGGYGNL